MTEKAPLEAVGEKVEVKVEVSRKTKNLGVTKTDVINSIIAKGFTHELSDKLEASGYFSEGEN